MNEEKKDKDSKDVENILHEEKDRCCCGKEKEGKCCREEIDTKEDGCCGGGCCGA